MAGTPRQIEWASNSTGSPAMTDDQFDAVHKSLDLVPAPVASRPSIGRPDEAGVSVVTLDGVSIGTVQRVSSYPLEPVRRGYNPRARKPVIAWYAISPSGEEIGRCLTRNMAVEDLVETRRESTGSGGDS